VKLRCAMPTSPALARARALDGLFLEGEIEEPACLRKRATYYLSRLGAKGLGELVSTWLV
jgi:hypothetical protein